ncbi:APC family permease [Sphingobium sp. Cam5-1]|uniref:APC family permease n=1 Tax=Sphingobium sp. Cam5-1 TaxID=2789327 RepID=UPI0018AD16FE|nr:APC family permease [Sphingobium sp. Cam5-1]QPI75111.1 APC family permease [Sphingobium sp. Cam5-1]
MTTPSLSAFPDAILSSAPAAHAVEPHGKLSGNMGVFDLTMTVLAASAPLSVMAAFAPVSMAVGNGVGLVSSFLIAGAALLFFAFGFMAMAGSIARKGEGAGAFYIYLTKGLGRQFGLGGAFLAIFAYTLLQTGTFGMVGVSIVQYLHARLGVPAFPWWIATAAAWAAVGALGYRRIDLSARMLGLAMLGEIGIVALLDAAVLWRGGPSGGLDFTPYSLTSLFSGNAGIGIMMAVGSFLGFEATAIYSEEVRSPDKTIPRATFLSIILIALFYSISTFLLINAYGVTAAAQKIATDPAGMFPQALGNYVGQVAVDAMYLLLISSLLAAVLSFHNAIARYFFNLGCDGVLPSAFGKTHARHGSPALGSLLQSATVVAVVVPVVLFKIDPVLQFYAWAVGLGTMGMLLLFAIASLAIIRYLSRQEETGSLWSYRIAPVLGFISLTAIAIYATINFEVFVDASPTLATLFLASLYATFAAGVGLAMRWRKTRPDWYGHIVTASTFPDDDAQ